MKSIPVYLLALLVIPYTVWGEDIYLEGISVVGAKKQAYLSLDGIRVVVSEGEAIGSWQVQQIIHKAVLLSTENGKQTTLALHTRLIPMEEKGAHLEVSLPIPEEPVEVIVEPPPVPEIPQPQEISDEEIPPGHRKVHTPFGDFIVKEAESNPNVKSLPVHLVPPEKEAETTEPVETLPAGEVPTGYRKIRTPFGEFLVEDKTQPLPAADKAPLE